MENGLIKYIEYWEHLFKSEDVENGVKKMFRNVPISIMNSVDNEVYPEPYYGDYKSDLSEDVILLLINPGSLENENKFDKVKIWWNEFIKNRITNWDKRDYLRQNELDNNSLLKKKEELSKEERFLIGGAKWRQKTLRQLNNIIQGPDFEFLYTMEFFPFHSKKWKSLSKKEKTIIFKEEFVVKTIHALIDITTNKRAKGVIAVGKPWVNLLLNSGFQFDEKMDYVDLKKHDRVRSSHKIWKFTYKNNCAPIIVYSSCSMNLPTDIEAVSIIRKWL